MNSEIKQNSQWKRKAFGFLAGQGISLFGSQIVQMAIIWHVTLETSSGFWVTVLTLAAFLPQMLISPFSGVWADRYNRKKIIILSDTIIALTTLLLALFMMSGNTGQAVLPALVIVSAIRSLGGGVHSPAVNAVLPQIVPEEELSRVNGFNGSIQSFVQFVSPVAAGALMSIGPVYNILFIDILTAIIGIGILAFLNIPGHQPIEKAERTSVFTEMKEGFHFTWNHTFLKRLFLIYGTFIFLSVPSGFLTVLMIKRTFSENVMFLTVNETVGFVGSLTGGLLIGITGGFSNRNKTFFLGLMVYGISSFAVGFSNVFWLFVILMFFIGMTIPAVQTPVFTLVQEKVHSSMLGRVFSLLNIMFSGFMPLGMLIFGPLADIVRIQSMVIVCAVLILLLATYMILTPDFYGQGYNTAAADELVLNSMGQK